jgi:hypothetical protein
MESFRDELEKISIANFLGGVGSAMRGLGSGLKNVASKSLTVSPGETFKGLKDLGGVASNAYQSGHALQGADAMKNVALGGLATGAAGMYAANKVGLIGNQPRYR